MPFGSQLVEPVLGINFARDGEHSLPRLQCWCVCACGNTSRVQLLTLHAP